MTIHRKRTIGLLLLMATTLLDMSHIQSYINSMCNIMCNNFNNKKIYLERKKCITSITLFNAQHNKVLGKEDLFNPLE